MNAKAKWYIGLDRGMNRVYVQEGENGTPIDIGEYDGSGDNSAIMPKLRELGIKDINNAIGPYSMPEKQFEQIGRSL